MAQIRIACLFGYLFFLKPVIAAFLAAIFLRQTLTAAQILAIAMICSSVLVEATWPQLRKGIVQSGQAS